MENKEHTKAIIVACWAEFAGNVTSRCGLGVNSTLQMMKPSFEKIIEDTLQMGKYLGKNDSVVAFEKELEKVSSLPNSAESLRVAIRKRRTQLFFLYMKNQDDE